MARPREYTKERAMRPIRLTAEQWESLKRIAHKAEGRSLTKLLAAIADGDLIVAKPLNSDVDG
jgi:hypothetical protein